MKKILIGIVISFILPACTNSGHNQQSWQPKNHHHLARNHHH